jgi:multiple sugar transport system substrate-binding protein
LKQKFEVENVLFGILIVAFVSVTLAMGLITFSQKPHPADKTLKILGPSDPSYQKLQDNLTKRYEEIHPDIKVKYIAFPWQNIWRKLEFLIVANIPPDVSNIEQPYLPLFVHMGRIEPLDEWMAGDSEFDPTTLFPKCMDEANWDNKQYALPTHFSPVGLLYNKTLFDKYGVAYPNRDWTRDDLLAAAKKLTNDLDGDGIVDQYGFFTNNNHWNRYPAWIWMTGGDFLTPDWKKSTFDNPKVVAGIRWLANLALKEGVAPKPSYLSNISSTNLILGGKLAMAAETRYFMANFYLPKNKDKIKDYTFDVSELPHGETRASCFVVNQIMIPSTVAPERKKMSWDYLKFVVSADGQKVIAGEDQGLGARIATAEEMVTRPGRMLEHDRAFLDSAAYARYCYWPFPADEQFTTARSDLMGVWNGQLDAEQVCRKAAFRITKAIADYETLHPDDHVPVKTQFVPPGERGKPATVASGPSQEAPVADTGE